MKRMKLSGRWMKLRKGWWSSQLPEQTLNKKLKTSFVYTRSMTKHFFPCQTPNTLIYCSFSKYFLLLPFCLQNIESQVQGLEDALNGLKEKAAQFDQPAIIDATSRSVCSLSHRWTRLLSVARAQVKALQGSARNWRCTREKVGKLTRDRYSQLITLRCSYMSLHFRECNQTNAIVQINTWLISR